MIYEFEGMRPKIAKSAYVSNEATIIGNVIISENCFIGPGAVIRSESPENTIFIDECSIVEDGVIVHVGGKGNQCYIGKHVTIGHGAIVHCSRLGDYANVGMGAVLSLLSEIGSNSVVAEGAIVKKGQVVPEKTVVGGAPAKVLRELEAKDIDTWNRSNAFYVELGQRYSAPGAMLVVDRESCM